MINAVRWFFLVGAIGSFLQATIFFRATQRWLAQSWSPFNDRFATQMPPLLRDRRFQRGWLLFMTLVFGLSWWFAGTNAGRSMFLPPGP